MIPFINEKSIARLKYELEKLPDYVLLGFGSFENLNYYKSLSGFYWKVSQPEGSIRIDYNEHDFAGTNGTHLYIIHKDCIPETLDLLWVVPDSIRHLVPGFKSNEITRTLTL